MSGSKVPTNVWLKNFKNAIQEMINEELSTGHTVTGIIMTQGLYNKLNDAYGYECVDFLGYVLEVIENDINPEDDDSQDMVLLKGNPLQ